MSTLLFQLAITRKQTNTPLLRQIGIAETFYITVDTTTLGSSLRPDATMSSLVGLMFGLRREKEKMAPTAFWLPAMQKPGPAPAFKAQCIEAWLDDPVIPTTQNILTRKDLICAVRDQDGGAHSDADAKLQKSIAYVELVNQFPASKATHVRTPEGVTFPWELLPPVTMPILRQISHELLSAIYSQTDIRRMLQSPSLICLFEDIHLKGAFVPDGYPTLGPIHGKTPAVIQPLW